MKNTLSAAFFLVFLLQFHAQAAPEIIVDNNTPQTSKSGSWANASGARNHHGTMSEWAHANSANGVDRYRFNPELAAEGHYEVQAWNSTYCSGGGRATNTLHRISHAAGVTDIGVDQSCGTGSHNEWYSLGVFYFDPATASYVEISNEGLDGSTGAYIGADAVKFIPQGDVDPPPAIVDSAPDGQLPQGTTQTTLTVEIDEAGYCRYAATGGNDFDNMFPMSTEDNLVHTQVVDGLEDGGSYSYFVKCRDLAGHTTASDHEISFWVASGDSSAISDEFNQNDVDPAKWRLFNDGQFDYEVSGGSLKMYATTRSAWYLDDNGPALLNRNLISGNFTMTTDVKARQALNPGMAVINPYDFAGIIVRDPASQTGDESYVFSVMGVRGSNGVDSITNEIKSTYYDTVRQRNRSVVHGPSRDDTNDPETGADSELLICRIGQMFYFYNKIGGHADWQYEHAVNRDVHVPLPNTVEVGPIVYSWNYRNPRNLVGIFDYIRVEPLPADATQADCTR